MIDCITKPTNAVVISHEKEATRRLFRGVKYYIDNLPIKPIISIDNSNEILFPKRNSSYWIGTAGQKAFGRGDEIHRAHLSEAAFYYDLETILAGVSEAAEMGQIDIESSPNGRATYFYDLWLKAKSGESPYTPIFIPWFIDDEYSADQMTEEEVLGLSPSVRELFQIPDREFPYTDEERELIKRVELEYNMTLTAGQIKWRRYKIWDKGNLFFQEYPEDDVSCFLQSGRPVFSEISIRPEFRIDLEKNLPDDVIEKLKSKHLFGGIDGAEGNKGGDSHCFSVLDVDGAGENKGAIIFEICNTDPIEIFDERVAKLIKKFNIRTMCEKQGVGAAHLLKFRAMHCPVKEWNTTSSSRSIMITDLEEAYRKEELIETYPEAENELRDMFYDSNNHIESPVGKHDDRVFSRAIAWQARKMPKPKVSWI